MTTKAWAIAKAALFAEDVHGMTEAFNKIRELAKGDRTLEVDAASKLMAAYAEYCTREYYSEQETHGGNDATRTL